MGKIVVSENVSLDGVVEDPSGEQGFRHGGWSVQFIGQDWEAWAEVELAEAQGAEALLWVAGATSTSAPVVIPERRAGGQVEQPAEVRCVLDPRRAQMDQCDRPQRRRSQRGVELKEQTEGDIVVYASRSLVRTLMEHDLVDELRLTVFPVALGAGERLFGETSDKRPRA